MASVVAPTLRLQRHCSRPDRPALAPGQRRSGQREALRLGARGRHREQLSTGCAGRQPSRVSRKRAAFRQARRAARC
eukprot:3935574-Rhodomonas_salina.1